MKRRMISTFLALFMALALLPTAAFADGPPTVLNPKDPGASKLSDIAPQLGGFLISGNVFYVYDFYNVPARPENPYGCEGGYAVITKISASVFFCFDKMCSATFPSELDIPASLGGYPVRAIQNCLNGSDANTDQLNTIRISDSVQYIDGSFSGLKNVTEITLPGGLKEIRNECFNNLPVLQKITLPSTLKSITSGTFRNLPALKNVTFSEGLQTIENAFTGTALTNVTLPASLSSIGGGAFSNTKTLAEVDLLNDNLQFTSGNVFLVCGTGADPSFSCPTDLKILCTSLNSTASTYAMGGGTQNGDGKAMIAIPCDYKIASKRVTVRAETNTSVSLYLLPTCGALTQDQSADITFTANKEKGYSKLVSVTRWKASAPGNTEPVDVNWISDKGTGVTVTVPYDIATSEDPYVYSATFAIPTWEYFCFGNARDNFYNANETKNYTTNLFDNFSTYLKKLYPGQEQVVNGKLSSVRMMMNNNWGGSCFGYAAVEGLYNQRLLPLARLDSDANTLATVDKAAQNHSVRDYLNYYYLTQFLYNEVRGQQYQINTEQGTNGLKTLVSAAKAEQKAMFCYFFREGANTYGHAFTIDGYTEQNGNFVLTGHDNRFYDCGDPRVMVTIPNDYSSCAVSWGVKPLRNDPLCGYNPGFENVVAFEYYLDFNSYQNKQSAFASLLPGSSIAAGRLNLDDSGSLAIASSAEWTLQDGSGNKIVSYDSTPDSYVLQDISATDVPKSVAHPVYRISQSGNLNLTNLNGATNLVVERGSIASALQAGGITGNVQMKMDTGALGATGLSGNVSISVTNPSGSVGMTTVSGNMNGGALTVTPAVNGATLTGTPGNYQLSFLVGSSEQTKNVTIDTSGTATVPYSAPSTNNGGSVTTRTLNFETNGGSSVAPVSKETGTTVNLKDYTTTRAGYTFAGWYSDKELTKPVSSVTLTQNTTVYAKWTVTLWKNPFVDVSDQNWFYGSVKFVLEKGLFFGTSDTTFSPNVPMTRAMLWTVLARLDGQNLSAGGSWYEKAQQWAKNKGLSDGFNPNDSITREQLVTMLWRYAGSPKPGGDLSRFSDADHVADYAKEAMAWAVEKGLIQGEGGRLMPQGNAERAQLAAILLRFCQNGAN